MTQIEKLQVLFDEDDREVRLKLNEVIQSINEIICWIDSKKDQLL